MKLKTYLAEINMTMKAFAEIVDCTPYYLSNIIRGKQVAGRRLAKDVEAITGGLVQLPTKEKKRDE